MPESSINSSPKKKGIWQRLTNYYYELLQQFLRNTALNGLKYLADKSLTILEKLFFLCCFIAAAYNSLSFAITIVEKWQTSPVIIVMNPETAWITQEPFPAITICNMNQARNSKVKDYKNDSLDYAMLQKLCFQELNFTSFTRAQPRSKDDSFANFIVKNTQPCSHMVAMCQLGNLVMSCSDIFREVLLDEGLCCSFNIMHPFLLYKGEYFMVRDFTSIDSQWIPVEWHPEDGYVQDLPNSFYPRVALGEGITNGLTLILNGDIDDYYCSSTNGAGFKVAVHNPIDIPNVKETGLFIDLGYQTSFRITTIRDEAAITLRSIKPTQRQCYFSDEHPLIYFQFYTQRNCEMECDAYFMLRECNCIPYHMPLVRENATVCHVRHFDCVVEAEKDFIDKKRLKCKHDCLSNCHDLTFTPSAFKTPLASREYVLQDSYFQNFTKEYVSTNLALLKVFYPENFYRSNIKTPYMGITEYLSQTGGIMSLMMGFSVISLVELVYFFVVKPLVDCWFKVFQRNIIDVAEVAESEEVEPSKTLNNLNTQTVNINQLQPKTITYTKDISYDGYYDFQKPHLPIYLRYYEHLKVSEGKDEK